MRQSTSDIRKKLQRMEGVNARSVDKLLEVAWKLYNNMAEVEKKEEEKKE